MCSHLVLWVQVIPYLRPRPERRTDGSTTVWIELENATTIRVILSLVLTPKKSYIPSRLRIANHLLLLSKRRVGVGVPQGISEHEDMTINQSQLQTARMSWYCQTIGFSASSSSVSDIESAPELPKVLMRTSSSYLATKLTFHLWLSEWYSMDSYLGLFQQMPRKHTSQDGDRTKSEPSTKTKMSVKPTPNPYLDAEQPKK